MTFSDIYGEVISLRFNNNFVAQAKSWVNTRYALVWNANEWTFREAVVNPVVTGGSATLGGLPSALQRVNYLYNSTGTPITYLTPETFYKSFYPASSSTGNPSYYTVINGVVTLGPTPTTSATDYLMIYEQKMVAMVNDLDVPLIPSEFHYILVHGALATGLVTQNDFTFAQEEEMYQELLSAMSNAYTSDYGGSIQYGRDQLGTFGTGGG